MSDSEWSCTKQSAASQCSNGGNEVQLLPIMRAFDTGRGFGYMRHRSSPGGLHLLDLSEHLLFFPHTFLSFYKFWIMFVTGTCLWGRLAASSVWRQVGAYDGLLFEYSAFDHAPTGLSGPKEKWDFILHSFMWS